MTLNRKIERFTSTEFMQQQGDHMWTKVQQGMNSTGFRRLRIGDQELRMRNFHKTLDDYLHRKLIRWTS